MFAQEMKELLLFRAQHQLRFPGARGQLLDPAPDFFQPLHVEHLFERYPRVLPYLALPALPPGWRFLFADGYEDVCKMIGCLLYDRD